MDFDTSTARQIDRAARRSLAAAADYREEVLYLLADAPSRRFYKRTKARADRRVGRVMARAALCGSR